MTPYEEMQKLCTNRTSRLIFDDDLQEEIEIFPCKYMINYYENRNECYFSDALQPSKENCFKCPYRNKNMGEKFEIEVEKSE